MNIVANNLKHIKEEIEAQAKEWQSPTPKLVAVSKRQELERVIAALEAGYKIFGENLVQEAQRKWPELKTKYQDIKLHLIGHLQRNKVKDALSLFEVIETIDSERLANEIKKHWSPESVTKEFLIQINIGEEDQKSGILPKDAANFIKYFRDELKLPLKGLMCIPPANENPSPYFAFMHKIAKENNLNYISQGMSGDYLEAIQVGTNQLRIGTAIFGNRD